MQSGLKQRKSDPDYRKLRKSLCIGYGNQLAEKMLHHNGYHTIGYRSQLVQVWSIIIIVTVSVQAKSSQFPNLFWNNPSLPQFILSNLWWSLFCN